MVVVKYSAGYVNRSTVVTVTVYLITEMLPGDWQAQRVRDKDPRGERSAPWPGQDDMGSHDTIYNSTLLNPYELLISGICHLIFSNYS